MVNSKKKGAVGEREVAALLRSYGFEGAKRGVQHAGRDKFGNDFPDVVCPELEWLHIEVKRTERFSSVVKAFEQVEGDKQAHQKGVIFWRGNGHEWAISMKADEFLELIRLIHGNSLGKESELKECIDMSEVL